jgi:hypothetical protein
MDPGSARGFSAAGRKGAARGMPCAAAETRRPPREHEGADAAILIPAAAHGFPRRGNRFLASAPLFPGHGNESPSAELAGPAEENRCAAAGPS